MINKLYGRIRIVSSQDSQYILLPDRMHEVVEETTPAEKEGNKPYVSHVVHNCSLSKAVVRRILKAGPEKSRRVRPGWRVLLQTNDARLTIGCQYFDYTAIQALRRWTGAV